MKNVLILTALLFLIGCKNTPESEELSNDEVEDFMENVFGEKKGKPFDCDALMAKADFFKACIGKEDDFRIKKDVENPLICIHVLKSEKSTVDVAINRSPMSIITPQVFRAAKADAGKKGTVKMIKRLGDDAFYTEYEFASGDYSTMNRDLIFYKSKSMYTLHTVGNSKRNSNCMSSQSQLKKLATAILAAAE